MEYVDHSFQVGNRAAERLSRVPAVLSRWSLEKKMVRILIAGVLGGAVYYVWGMMVWMVIPLHAPTVNQFPNEDAVIEVLTAQNLETGVYSAPGFADESDMSNPDSEFNKKHAKGPIFSVYYHADGSPPMPTSMLLNGFLINFLAAAIAACLLSTVAGGCCGSYLNRGGFVTGLGVFVALIGHLSYWNWMYFPLDYTLGFVVDVVVGWSLAGLIMAAVVRPEACAAKGDSKDAAG